MFRILFLTLLFAFSLISTSHGQHDFVDQEEICYIKTDLIWPEDQYGQRRVDHYKWDMVFDWFTEALNKDLGSVVGTSFKNDNIIIAYHAPCENAFQDNRNMFEQLEKDINVEDDEAKLAFRVNLEPLPPGEPYEVTMRKDFTVHDICFIRSNIDWLKDGDGNPVVNEKRFLRLFESIIDILRDTSHPHITQHFASETSFVLGFDAPCEEAYIYAQDIIKEYQDGLSWFQKWFAPDVHTLKEPMVFEEFAEYAKDNPESLKW